MARQRDVQRNSAYFLGAFGTTLGILGGGLAGLGILAWLVPSFAETAPDWFFALFLIVLLALFIGAWPALDWLINRRPEVGGRTLAVLGAGLILEGAVSVAATDWGIAGWFALVGGLLMLLAAQLAVLGGGTEPLTWRSLRTERIQRIEAHADQFVTIVIGLVSVAAIGVTVAVAVNTGDPWTVVGMGSVPTAGLSWLAFRRWPR